MKRKILAVTYVGFLASTLLLNSCTDDPIQPNEPNDPNVDTTWTEPNNGDSTWNDPNNPNAPGGEDSTWTNPNIPNGCDSTFIEPNDSLGG